MITSVLNVLLLLLAGMRGKILDFNQRLEIAIDVAHALTYLHLYAGKNSSRFGRQVELEFQRSI